MADTFLGSHMALIELREVGKVYGGGESRVSALKNIDLSIESGEFVAITGVSGSGKSTLLNILGGLDRPTTGSYLLAGEPVETKGEKALARMRGRRIGFIFQTFNLIPRLTVFRNAELPMIYGGSSPFVRRRRVMEALRAVQLDSKANRRPDQLSGGEVQRVAIARALVNDPEIFLADEPTGNLDSRTGDEILNILVALNGEGRTIILVTHNDEIAGRASRRLVMSDGELREVS